MILIALLINYWKHFSLFKIIILLMEAIILGSRSINQDKFFQKDQEEKFKKHREIIGLITNVKQTQAKEWEK